MLDIVHANRHLVKGESMTFRTASARYGVHTRILLAALLIGGCERVSESPEPTELTLDDIYVLVEQPHEYEAWWRNFRRICASAPDPALCELGGEVFRQRCAGCHGAWGVYERKGPSLLGLLGRTRGFFSGSTVVADEGYLRRAVQHHSADLEYVPGWKGTTYLPSGDPSALAYERHRKHLESKYYGLNHGTGDALDGLVALLAALSPTPGPMGTVTYELNGIDGDRAEAIRKEIEPRLESVHHCYAVARATSAALHGEKGDPGKLVLRLEGSRDWRDLVTRRENIEHEFARMCGGCDGGRRRGRATVWAAVERHRGGAHVSARLDRARRGRAVDPSDGSPKRSLQAREAAVRPVQAGGPSGSSRRNDAGGALDASRLS